MAVMERYTYSKQVNALRILVLLLPQMHKSLLQRLFTLLHRVTTQVARNRMSPLALGTVFGPVLVPSVFSESLTMVDGFQNKNSEILKRGCQDAITLATRMIVLNNELFLFPTRLINDIRDNASSKTPTRHSEAREKRSDSAWCSPYRRGYASRRSSSPINTSIRYAHIGYSTPQMFHDVSNTTAINASPVSTDKINTSSKSSNSNNPKSIWESVFPTLILSRRVSERFEFERSSQTKSFRSTHCICPDGHQTRDLCLANKYVNRCAIGSDIIHKPWEIVLSPPQRDYNTAAPQILQAGKIPLNV
ncbi:hypothetical protein ACTXT7_008604 [Hymenolepis weldensis]